MPATLITTGLILAQALGGTAPKADPEEIQASVLKSCQLQSYQFSVERLVDRLRVQRSPTLSSDQAKCVDRVLSQWKVQG